jgi:carboxylesterase type B
MFWLYGGAFVFGTGADHDTDGGNLASRGDVVVVTINYRLAALGFLALDNGVNTGNYAIGDMVSALDWVRSHIRDFGGDPNKITIFGQSAGAGAVRALLGSPKAIGKFQAAISMSNLAGTDEAKGYSDYYTIAEEMAVAGRPTLEATGCINATDIVSCLREYDPLQLVSQLTTPR